MHPEYQPCSAHLTRATCVHCGETPAPYDTENDALTAYMNMRQHIDHDCTQSIRPGCSAYYDAVYPAEAGIILCLDCVPADHYVTMPHPERLYPSLYYPLTADDEADSYATCDSCHRRLTYHRLTREGKQYEAAAAVETGRDDEARELLASIADKYAYGLMEPNRIHDRRGPLLAIVQEAISEAGPDLLEFIAAELTDYEPGARASRRDRLIQEWRDGRSYADHYTRDDHAADIERYYRDESPPRNETIEAMMYTRTRKETPSQ